MTAARTCRSATKISPPGATPDPFSRRCRTYVVSGFSRLKPDLSEGPPEGGRYSIVKSGLMCEADEELLTRRRLDAFGALECHGHRDGLRQSGGRIDHRGDASVRVE